MALNLENIIDTHYINPTEKEISQLRLDVSPIALQSTSNILLINSYYRDGIAGAASTMWTRSAVWQRLLRIAELLKPYHAGLMIFDTFRTLETQKALFQQFSEIIKSRQPHLSASEIFTETRKFVYYPEENGFVPPHNSGGAIDLAIYPLDDQHMWNFGGEFDEISAKSGTDFFEKTFDPALGFNQEEWSTIQKNRRILFNLMKGEGFTNYEHEWWHYDLGDCFWCEKFNVPLIFDSMENYL